MAEFFREGVMATRSNVSEGGLKVAPVCVCVCVCAGISRLSLSTCGKQMYGNGRWGCGQMMGIVLQLDAC